MAQAKYIVVALLSCCLFILSLTSCDFVPKKEKKVVTIYTSIEDYRIEYLNKRFAKEFPQYDIRVGFFPTGNHIAKLLEEGTSTECDITHSLEYTYLEQLDAAGFLADLSSYNKKIYEDNLVISENFLPQERGSGAIVLNTRVLEKLGLREPATYEDLLKPEYRGLVSMPNPRDSSTGYIFYKSLVNAWGKDKALAFFDKLTNNILQYTKSGSGPLNAAADGKVAVALGTTPTAVVKINAGAPLKIVAFREGAPYAVYGQAIIKGKEKGAL